MSTTLRPATWTHTPAPMSLPDARLAESTSRTGSKPWATSPPSSGIVDDAAQLLDRLHGVRARCLHGEHGDAGFLVGGHPLGHVGAGTDQRRLLQPLVGHLGRRLVLLAVEVQVLDLDGLV